MGHTSLEPTHSYTSIRTMEACLKQLELGLDVGEGPDRTISGNKKTAVMT